MPEKDVRAVFEMTKKLFEGKASPYAPVGKQQILQDVDAAWSEAQAGKTLSAADAVAEVKKSCGL